VLTSANPSLGTITGGARVLFLSKPLQPSFTAEMAEVLGSPFQNRDYMAQVPEQ
jgi:hypothetical protein